jgi:acetyl esterase
MSGLDPDARAILDVIDAAGLPPLQMLSVAEARERTRSALVLRRPRVVLASIDDHTVPTPNGVLRLRTYRPATGALPVALFLHGGGWTLNDLDTHDHLCRTLAQKSGWLIASLDFRRAPEHRHPGALEDSYYGYRWLLDNASNLGGDPTRRALIGESSGATTVASLSLLLRQRGGPMPDYQVLACPVTDRFDRWPSYQQHGSGYILDRDLIQWYFGHYLPESWTADDPMIFPLAEPDLRGLPATLMVTAEFDPLRDEGIAYADRLSAAGVTVDHIHAHDQMHGFLLLDSVVPRCAELLDRVGGLLARAGECGPNTVTRGRIVRSQGATARAQASEEQVTGPMPSASADERSGDAVPQTAASRSLAPDLIDSPVPGYQDEAGVRHPLF